MNFNYMSCLLRCSEFFNHIQNFNIDENGVRGIKFHANQLLTKMSANVESGSLKEIALASLDLHSMISIRIDQEGREELERLLFKVFQLADSEINNVKWIAKLKDKLCIAKVSSDKIPCFEEKYSTKQLQMKQLATKISVLENVLTKYASQKNLISKYSFYKENGKLKMVIEMLLLDIMSILGDSKKKLTDNILFLDDDSPLLVGRNLRNHLAHGNALLDILFNDSTLAIIINAQKIISENGFEDKRKIGKSIINDIFNVRTKFNQELFIIANQNLLFNALENGSFEGMERCIKDGADLLARSLGFSTALHFASKGGNSKIVKFLLYQKLSVTALDKFGQNPLHIAAAWGHKNIAELLLQKHGDVGIKDSDHKTPLHLAAQNGQTDVIKVLLRNKAPTNILDSFGCLPIHCALINNHKKSVELLLPKQDIDADVMLGGFTALHVVAERGYSELVKLLLKNKANVNVKTDKQTTPLHLASLNGHLAAVKSLVSAGAHVNIKTNDGGTALHYAVENNHTMVLLFLLDQGADLLSVDCLNFTPLNFAAGNGVVEIAKILLDKGSDINHRTLDGRTSLYLAAENGHLESVKFFMSRKAIFNIKNNDNKFSPLHASALSNHSDVVRHLIDSGADINDKDVFRRTPLHLSAMSNSKKAMEVLISLGAKLELKDLNGSTALHLSVENGHHSVAKLLIVNGANVNVQNNKEETLLLSAIVGGSVELVDILVDGGVNTKFVDSSGFTTLHMSALFGKQEIVKKLLALNCDVNAKCKSGLTPLHIAAQGNHLEVMKVLIKHKAEVNAEDTLGKTPLCKAVENNCKEIANYLIKSGADINKGYPLFWAIQNDFYDIIQILIQNNCKINFVLPDLENVTPLHLAASRGQETVVNALILKGASIHFTTSAGTTALHCAALEGHCHIVDILSKKKAKLNARTGEGYSPLSLAATSGHSEVVKTLLKHGANPNIADFKNRTSIELAVAHNQMEVVKVLLQNDRVDVNEKGDDDFSLLHIAAQEGLLEMTKLLIENGADFMAKNFAGSKPIHYAARDGHQEVLEFYLRLNKLDDLGVSGQTLMHYAASTGQSKILKYLITLKMNINISDKNGVKPIHFAAMLGFEDAVRILMDNGAHFNAIHPYFGTALHIATHNNHKQVTKLLTLSQNFFEAVKQNNISESEKYIKEGAVVNVINRDEITPLHYASWKGFNSIVTILLKNNANPNIVGKSGCTPLHYATKFNHFDVVKTLLLHKAAYDIASNNSKIPLDFATHPDIIELLRFIDEAFKSVKNNNTDIISKLNNWKDKNILKIVMNAHNKDNKTLVVIGMHYDFSKIKSLKNILQDEMSIEKNIAYALCSQERYEEALTIFKSVFENRKSLLGLDNPDTLEMHFMIAKILYKQHKYQEALSVSEDIYQQQKELFGDCDSYTLETKRLIAVIHHRQGKNETALAMYQKLLPKQLDILGPNHTEVLSTRSEMALVLNALSKYEEALSVNYEILKIQKKQLGVNHPLTLAVKNNIAMVLSNLGKYDKALEMYTQVYEERKKILGPYHSDTLRAYQRVTELNNITRNKSNTEALEKVVEIQKNVLGLKHLDTLNSQYSLAKELLFNGKLLESHKIFEDILNSQKSIRGANHSVVLDIENKIKAINFAMSMKTDFEDTSYKPFPQNANKIYDNCSNWYQLAAEDKVNIQDENGLTPLHYAANNGDDILVKQLLILGANPMLISSKGNTVLHIASSKGFTNILDFLLAHVKQNIPTKINDFLNAKTSNGGTTALHVAANLNIAICLLKYGAVYNVKNKNGETPFKTSKEKEIVNLLGTIGNIFTGVKKENFEIIETIRKLRQDELEAVFNARNLSDETLSEILTKKDSVYAKKVKKLVNNLNK